MIYDGKMILARGRCHNDEWVYGAAYYNGAYGYIVDNVVLETNLRERTNRVTSDIFLVDPNTIGFCVGCYAATSYRGDKGIDRLLFGGDIVRCNVMRLGGTHSMWARKSNKNHGRGFYITMQVVWHEDERRPFDSKWRLEKIPNITDAEIQALESPMGAEKYRQYINYLNVKPEDCEILGNIHDNPELLQKEVERMV